MKVVILASGGDAPGMNECIHEITKNLVRFKKNEVFACLYGFQGLIEGRFVKISTKQTRVHKNHAGVFIKSSRCLEFKTEKGVQKAVDNINANKFDVVVVLGGDGSYRGCVELMKKGVNVIFVPATIDRDLHYDTYTIGFYTAVSACCHYIHDVKPTMDAFDRICVYEIMGRDNPSLTKLVGDIVEADLIITKDNINNVDYNSFVEKHKQNPVRTVVLQERLVPIESIVQKLEQLTGGAVRQCVIGYIQRGTAPTFVELTKARMFGWQTYQAIKNKKFGFALCIDEIGSKLIKIS